MEGLKWDLFLVANRYKNQFPFGRNIKNIPRKVFGNSLTTGTDSIGGISEFRSWTLTILYRQPLEIILHAFRQEMIRPLGIKFPSVTLQQVRLES